MAELQKASLISSIAVLARTGLSRATLNNYIKMGMIPPPIVKKPDDPSLKAKQMGYFQDSILGTIEKIKLYKKEGHSMEEISSLMSLKTNVSPGECFPESRENETGTVGEKGHAANRQREILETTACMEEMQQREKQDMSVLETNDIQLTIHDLHCPAYLINDKFEIEWINAEAEEIIFGRSIRSIKIAEARNVFRLLIDMGSSWESRGRLSISICLCLQRDLKKRNLISSIRPLQKTTLRCLRIFMIIWMIRLFMPLAIPI